SLTKPASDLCWMSGERHLTTTGPAKPERSSLPRSTGDATTDLATGTPSSANRALAERSSQLFVAVILFRAPSTCALSFATRSLGERQLRKAWTASAQPSGVRKAATAASSKIRRPSSAWGARKTASGFLPDLA